MGGWWRWALVSPDGVAHSRMVNVSASINLLLHHKVQKFSSGTGLPGWSWKKGRKTGVCMCVCGNSNNSSRSVLGPLCHPIMTLTDRTKQRGYAIQHIHVPVLSQDKLGGLRHEGHLA